MAGAGAILLLLALAMVYVGYTNVASSANADLVRTTYFAAAAVIVAIAIVVWASR